MVMSSTDGRLVTALQGQDAHLEILSQRAEHIRNFSRYVRKASLTTAQDVDLPFAGYVGAASQVEPGATLKLGRPGFDGHALEIVSALKIRPAIALAAAAPRSIDLMLITGRVVGAPDAPLVRLLVAVTPDKPALDKPTGAVEHQTL